uniref:Leukocyte surface antigen CD47 n=1 Tax=Strix occidentalis caurina TaxID=311401 RepID=A0A8D0FBR0_STROC
QWLVTTIVLELWCGSAQLMFSVTDVVEKTECNKTVILPCHVINLKGNNANVMFVTWKKQGKRIFSFDGARQQFYRDPTVPSANLASLADLPKGIASLMLDGAEAAVGNYSCEVTELNREGETTVELRQRIGELPAIVLEPVGRENKQNLMGKRKITNMTVRYFKLKIQKTVIPSLPQTTFALIGLQILGYIIAVVGFALCVSACPPLHGSVVIAGLAIMAIANLLSLAYVFIMDLKKMKDLKV